ncbi:auxin-responsive protein IAA21-like [Canna indica]|uniref:Auxin-responsive protein n=1 Tax=Canna indica TaxID=4628 RepID=A0AAQ3K367_9LILI|nr:auxin-responsive protein IAA21-like [Canna indica]
MTPPLEHDYIGLSSCGGGALELEDTELRLGLPGSVSPDKEVDGGGTVGLSLGLPSGGLVSGAKRGFSNAIGEEGKWGLAGLANGSEAEAAEDGVSFSARGEDAGGAAEAAPPAAKAQIVGWPPIRSYRKNTMASNHSKIKEGVQEGRQEVECLYVKVSMDGAPYLRKVDLKNYSNYEELSLALEKMFTCFTAGDQGCSNGVSGRVMLMDLLQGSEYVLTYEDKDGDWMLVGDVPWGMFTDSCRRMRIMKGSDAIGIAPRTMEKSKSKI